MMFKIAKYIKDSGKCFFFFSHFKIHDQEHLKIYKKNVHVCSVQMIDRDDFMSFSVFLSMLMKGFQKDLSKERKSFSFVLSQLSSVC